MKRQIRDWEKEKERISQIQQISEIVKLNVGGHKDIDVRKSTLTQVKGSALEAMFSGRHQLQTVDGRVFIDRDPGTFKMVIEFIRNQGNMSEIQANNCKGFLNELNFWGMDPKYFEVDRSDIEIAQECIDKCNLRGIFKEKTENEFIKKQLENLEPFNLRKLIESNKLSITENAKLERIDIVCYFKDNNQT